MTFGPFARILLRYGIGYFAGAELGDQLAMDADLTGAISIAMAAAVEGAYAFAKRKGWAT